ncbi:hypothetical protein AB0K60_28640 [Thermopolyspora sp. NPDC052614]|uniref:hypothetical protein n=1 Tax=Thermopolyspora sp. NPDC052614 TaxID=3155682 RepID=UPI00342F383A
MAGEGDRQDERRRLREQNKGTTFDPDLHNRGGDVGPASIRGSNLGPGDARDEAEPKSGYSEPMGHMAGRDDEYTVTAGSDEKSVGARTDEVEPHSETWGPSPHPTPEVAEEGRGRGGRPGFRVRGPVDERLEGLIDDSPEYDDIGPGAREPQGGGHVTGDMEWANSDADDPDAGSGRTDADDGGYLPGEGTGRPFR